MFKADEIKEATDSSGSAIYITDEGSFDPDEDENLDDDENRLLY